MFRRLNNRNKMQTYYSEVYLSNLIAILFLFYQYFFIHSIITWTGMCISTYWLAGDNPLTTLYSLFFFIVALIFIWIIGLLSLKYRKRISLTLFQRIFYPICLLALFGWMFHLIIMMFYFEWEHQIMDFSTWEKIITFDLRMYITGEEYPYSNLPYLFFDDYPRPVPGPGCLTSADDIPTIIEWIELNY